MKYFIHSVILTALLVVAPLATAVPAVAAQAAAAPADTELAAQIKTRIAAEAEFKDSEVTVAAAGGVVTLTGVASSPLVRAKIGELTVATSGVSKVNNKLTLSKAKK